VALVGRDVFLTTLWLHPWLNKSQKLIKKTWVCRQNCVIKWQYLPQKAVLEWLSLEMLL